MMERLIQRVPFLFVALLLLTGFCGSAQTKAEIAVAKKVFEGRWVNKKAKRHLTISFDTEYYATINDWTGKVIENVNSIDAYKAFVRQGKLVMPEDKTDLRAPYCEIVKQGNTLLYRCRGMNTKDQRFIDQVVFTRERE